MLSLLIKSNIWQTAKMRFGREYWSYGKSKKHTPDQVGGVNIKHKKKHLQGRAL